MIELMECVNAVRPKLWRGRGRDLPGPVAYVDVDGTLAPTLGRRRAGMDVSHKGAWGYHPLIVSLANTGRARRATLRIIGWQPSVDRLFSVWRAIERTGFG